MTKQPESVKDTIARSVDAVNLHQSPQSSVRLSPEEIAKDDAEVAVLLADAFKVSMKTAMKCLKNNFLPPSDDPEFDEQAALAKFNAALKQKREQEHARS